MSSILATIETLFESLPTVDAMQTLLVFGFVPIFLFLLSAWCYQSRLAKRRRSGKPVKFIYAMGYVLHKHAGLIALLTFLWTIFLTISQSVYVYHHLTVGTDINYYLQVNLPEYEGVSNIDDAKNLNSLNVVIMEYGNNPIKDQLNPTNGSMSVSLKEALKLHMKQKHDKEVSNSDSSVVQSKITTTSTLAKRARHVQEINKNEPNHDNVIKYKQGIDSESHHSTSNSVKTVKQLLNRLKQQQGSSSLQTSQSQTLSIVYHTDNWDNMLTADNLINICRTEQKMIQEMTCLNIWHYKSMIPTIFDISTCTYYTSFEQSLYKFGLSENEAYVEDSISSIYPRSNILISFFKTGTCSNYNENQLVKMFNNIEIDNIEITYVSEDFIQIEFNNAIYDALYYSIVTIIFCLGFMIFGVRGIIITILTLFSIIISIIHASSILPYWDYGSFSAFNVLSIFILIGIGANAVLMFGSAWRRIVQPAYKKATPSKIIHAYMDISQSVLFTTCAACISLFSKLCSPVIVISQLGAFMGIAVSVFYILFHFIIIPSWIYTSRWTWPKVVHHKCNSWYKTFCCCFIKKHRGNDNNTNGEVMHDSFLAMPTSPYASAPMISSGGNSSSYSPIAMNEHRNDSEFTLTQPMVSQSTNTITTTTTTPASCIAIVKKSCCNILTCSGIISLLLTIFGLLLVYYYVNKSLKVDFGIPQLFDPNTNIGESMYIVKHYKSDIFTMHDNSIDFSPTFSPVFAVPSFRPTSALPTMSFRPSAIPTTTSKPSFSKSPTAPPSISFTPTISFSPSASPSLSFTPTYSLAPTRFVLPTITPTAFPSQSNPPSLMPSRFPTTTSMPTINTKKHVDYTVTGCWGIYASKEFIDSDSVLSFHSDTFKKYSQGNAVNGIFYNSGLLTDMQSMCDYIQNNRNSLDVSPDWVKDRDCIYGQVIRASQSNYWNMANAPPFTVNNVLVYWASLDYSSGNLLGVEVNQNITNVSPVWLCFNISARTEGVSSLNSDATLAVKLSDRWTNAFNKHGSNNAKKYNLPIIIGSTEFTFPMLASEVLFSIELSTIISVAGFIFLLFVFTKADIGLTLLGTLAMITIIAVSVCIHEYVFVGEFDLLDIVVLIAVMGMAVDFPIHFLMEFVNERDKEELKKRSIPSNIREQTMTENPPTSAPSGVIVESGGNSNSSEVGGIMGPNSGGGSSGMNPDYIPEELLGIDLGEENGGSWLIADQLVIAIQQAREHRVQTNNTGRNNNRNGNNNNVSTYKHTSISPILAKTHRYLFMALIPPMILTILSGLPLLRAEFQLLRKCGQYVIILAGVSYIFCIIFLPYYMPLGYRLRCRICCKDDAQGTSNNSTDLGRNSIRSRQSINREQPRTLSEEYVDLELDRDTRYGTQRTRSDVSSSEGDQGSSLLDPLMLDDHVVHSTTVASFADPYEPGVVYATQVHVAEVVPDGH